MDLNDKVILITGAGSGIGRETSLVCAEYGATIIALDINFDQAQKTEQMIRDKGGVAYAVKADITNRDQIRTAVQKIIEDLGKIDVLVNNAGSTKLSPMIELDDSTLDFIIDLNLKGPFIVSAEVAKVMIPKKKGRIINITSYCAVREEYANAPYCMAKAAVKMMTRVQALELGKYNINTVAVAPGDTNTELLKDAFERRAKLEGCSVEEIYKRKGEKVPLGRVGEPDDIAQIVAFLSDDRSYFINGSHILATGGYVTE